MTRNPDNCPGLYRSIVQPTPFGPVALVWSGSGGSVRIERVLISRPGVSAIDEVLRLCPGTGSSACPEIDSVSASVLAFLGGDDVRFPLEMLNFKRCTPFQEAVLRLEHGIPRGKVSTYHLLARRAGNENAARAAGNALARNPFPILIPCHRAIRSDCTLGGFQGGPAMKRALLEMEGIRFGRTGRVICTGFHYG
ncbi:methylated-DNA-[protein]-cysteine S-methyltransferase [Methanolinea mesophila]|uniref:methylated-DNA--[protein]-cysteine S-methyltransferase n=1 Tax=Methanolinea mesophila TaxID=547055 RepID=UPI001AE37D60|nr:methylated-DNA--[protein]-cysteine S-methyltransferase [Methanolinea mesophila]MBP1929185.1 methylated-DNA-[protein]-cysteine S-methyltransferase [Methanolinea mesophila]